MDTLCNLNPNKACGIDNIPAIVLKSYACAVVLLIHHLFTTVALYQLNERCIKSLLYTNLVTQPLLKTTEICWHKALTKTAHINPIMNSYFYCLPRLWNSLPIIDLSQSLQVIITNSYGTTF